MSSGNNTKEKTEEMLDVFEIHGLDKRYPSQLSGGQHQRVALARALITRPKASMIMAKASTCESETAEKILKYLWALNKKLEAPGGVRAISINP